MARSSTEFPRHHTDRLVTSGMCPSPVVASTGRCGISFVAALVRKASLQVADKAARRLALTVSFATVLKARKMSKMMFFI